jgi:hypothetical protein
MGRRGLGKLDGRFHIEQVAQAGAQGEWLPVYTPAGSLQAAEPALLVLPEVADVTAARVTLVTPYRSVQQGRLVRAADFSARQFLGTLLRRVSMLQAFHTDTPLLADFKALSGLMATLEVAENTLHWHDWARYSSRQQALIKMGGLLGTFELRGEALATFLPLLRAGEQVHVGKAAVMGLGEYRLDVV